MAIMLQSCNCSALASAVVWKTRISYVSQDVFSPLNWDVASKTGMALKYAQHPVLFFDVYFCCTFDLGSHLGVFLRPQAYEAHWRWTQALELFWRCFSWDGFSSEVETSQQHRMREAPGVDRWHEFMNCWHGFFNHGQMMQALKLLHGFLLFVILYSCFFDIPERLCEIKHTWLHGLGYGKLLNFQPQLQVQWNMSRLFRNPVQDPFC